jgi:hypothetical protein
MKMRLDVIFKGKKRENNKDIANNLRKSGA